MADVEAKSTQFRCFSILAILTLCLVFVPAAAAENLLTNPGFEEGTTGWANRGSYTLSTSTVSRR